MIGMISFCYDKAHILQNVANTLPLVLPDISIAMIFEFALWFTFCQH